MSNKMVQELWLKTQSDLQRILSQETHATNAKPEKDRIMASKMISRLYMCYVRALRAFETLYEHCVHPQKRLLMRKTLIAIIIRILELKQEMVALECLEFSFISSQVLLELRMTPHEAELVVPSFFRDDDLEENARFRAILDRTIEKIRREEIKEEETPCLQPFEAALLLQNHERARQARLRARLMRDIRRQEALEKAKSVTHEAVSTAIAATKIQTLWKGALTRRQTRIRRQQEFVFIGMVAPSEQFSREYRDQLGDVREHRRVLQKEFQDEFEKALVNIKDEIRETEGQEMAEDMKSTIRNWINKEREEAGGRFPDYPSDDEGGSKAIFTDKTKGDVSITKGNTTSSNAASATKKKPRRSIDASMDRNRRSEGADEESGFVLRSSDTVRQLMTSHRHFEREWRHRDERLNPEQRFERALVMREKRREVSDEVRLQVDALMRDELDRLKMASERDRGKRGKPSKKRKRGKKKGTKKVKKRREKDLTPDRSTESLFEELVANNIIKKVEEKRLSDFIGNSNLAADLNANDLLGPTPSGGDIRRLITELCILPLGSVELHERSPLLKSLLLAAPSGMGKTLLVQIICGELGATFFDLSASNIAGKYPGKSGLNMLLHLVLKVARLRQPSVIYVDRAEKTFLKKVAKTDKTDPKRLKKELPKLVRAINPEDRIILIGESNRPWECEQKGLSQTYQKLLYLPPAAYIYRESLWRELMANRGGHVRRWSHWGPNFDLANLARVSDSFSNAAIAKSVESVLTERRLSQQTVRPLNNNEFVAALCREEVIHREEQEAFEAWVARTNLGRRRSRTVRGDDEEGGRKERRKTGRRGIKKK